jgi:sarcosine oxidase
VRTLPDADVAVVGLGAWGAAALWQLAERGVNVMGVDQFQPGHAFGSSHGRTRMFRTACLEHPGLVPLARRSSTLWRELAAAAGADLVAATGGVLIGPRDGRIVAGTLEAARAHDLPVEVWDAAELRRRLPQHAQLPDHHCGVWDPDARLLRAEPAVNAAVRVAEARGARVLTDTRVVGLELVDDGVVVHTAARGFVARQVVVAAGPWLSTLMPDLPLRVLRMPQTWFRPVEPSPLFALDALPVFMRELDDGVRIFGHGAEADGELKLGMEDPGGRFEEVDPDTCDRSVLPTDWDMLGQRLASAVPGMPQVPSRVGICFFTTTPDNQFLLGRPRQDPRIVIAGGCNSHGFKHATGIGEVVADLVLGKDPSVPITFMDPDRFG